MAIDNHHLPSLRLFYLLRLQDALVVMDVTQGSPTFGKVT